MLIHTQVIPGKSLYTPGNDHYSLKTTISKSATFNPDQSMSRSLLTNPQYSVPYYYQHWQGTIFLETCLEWSEPWNFMFNPCISLALKLSFSKKIRKPIQEDGSMPEDQQMQGNLNSDTQSIKTVLTFHVYRPSIGGWVVTGRCHRLADIYSSWNGKLWVLCKTVSKIKWRFIEVDTRHQPLASMITQKHTQRHMHTPHTHFKKMFSSQLSEGNLEITCLI